MKKQFFKKITTLLFYVALTITMIGCSDDTPSKKDDPNPITLNFGITTVSGAWPNQTSYIQGAEDLTFSTLGNEKALELNGNAGTVSYNKALYASPFGAPATLVKYSFNDNGDTVEEERIVVPGANTFSTVYFENESVAYASVAGGISKLIIFNPTTMRITGEVALTSITKRFPEATRTYYLDMIARDSKLFMGLHYENNFAPLNDSAYVAVIDLNQKVVEKIISDKRTGMVFGGQAANAGMIKTTNGDIYVQGLGTKLSGGNSPSGLLKISNGQTSFDPDYFMDMQNATGNVCYGIYQMPNGRSFTAKVEDATDFYEFKTNQPQFKYFELDLQNKSSLGAVPGLPTTYGSRRMIILPYKDNKLLFTTATNDENAVFSFDTTSNTSSKLFTSNGGFITGLEDLNN
ncbi:hypothetical protein CXF68_20135 [Tenacibaculum sp. Bg11-29]|uniref:DUF4374 domain-containing protein n=1 Tax=Tenacibaculum sp. Bg11-29 TaxID=2058306 RepID=UPI000C323AB8|nr:DUF4374 domain-containing protein [Tenacibaculum sp. Bg11-29]PKH52865.1 hypothetical protein CXF68_20135 [Tenacibaculum sp. Bg11-29]